MDAMQVSPGTERPMEKLNAGDMDLLKHMYRDMVLIRRFEEETARAYAMGKFGGFCHLYIGQEAVGVGAIHALNEKDYIISTYRDHGHALARGCEPGALMAELLGKRTGLVKGKGGSMHYFDRNRNFMGGHGIVGAHVALASGIGWAIKYRKENAAVICFFGEGAANIGAFHEGLNLAALWNLPVVFVCENNHYSMGTPKYKALSVPDVSIRAVAYSMDRDLFDGDDALFVQKKVAEHVEKARSGGGPSLLEISTYRFRGHSMSDPAKYRTKEEVEIWKARDPLIRGRKMLEFNGVEEKEFARIEAEVKDVVASAVKFAEESPEPSPADLYTDVYTT